MRGEKRKTKKEKGEEKVKERNNYGERMGDIRRNIKKGRYDNNILP